VCAHFGRATRRSLETEGNFRPHPGKPRVGCRRSPLLLPRACAGVLSAGTDLAAGLFLPISPMRSTFQAATIKATKHASFGGQQIWIAIK
jgi:hypothetical protein